MILIHETSLQYGTQKPNEKPATVKAQASKAGGYDRFFDTDVAIIYTNLNGFAIFFAPWAKNFFQLVSGNLFALNKSLAEISHVKKLLTFASDSLNFNRVVNYISS